MAHRLDIQDYKLSLIKAKEYADIAEAAASQAQEIALGVDVPGGIASLDENGKLKEAQRPTLSELSGTVEDIGGVPSVSVGAPDGVATLDENLLVREKPNLKVSDVVALRALEGKDGVVVILDEQTTNNSGGGVFQWSSVDPYGNGDDGGIVLSAPTGYWVRKFDTDIHVDWFRPNKDGVTDDLSIIQKALNISISLDRNLVFSSGDYLLSDRVLVVLPTNSNLVVKGVGNVRFISNVPEPSLSTIQGVFQFVGNSTSKIKVENIEVVHNATTNGALACFYFENAFKSVDIENLSAIGASYFGIYINGSNSVYAKYCNGSYNMYGGLGLQDCDSVVVSGGVYSNNGSVAPTYGYGISSSTTLSGVNRNVLIQGVTAENNKRKGIDVHNGHNVVISGNFVKGFALTGIYAANEGSTKSVADIIITNNVIDNEDHVYVGAIQAIQAGSFGTTPTTSGTFNISDNIIKNIGSSSYVVDGIHVLVPTVAPSPDRVIINNNTINGSILNRAIYTSNGIDIKNVVCNGNIINAEEITLVPIYIFDVERVTVRDNHLYIASGTPSNAIIASASNSGTIKDNNIDGSATFTGDVIPVVTTLVVEDNFINSIPYYIERKNANHIRSRVTTSLSHGVNTKVLTFSVSAGYIGIHGDWFSNWQTASTNISVGTGKFVTAARWSSSAATINLPGASPYTIPQIGEATALSSGITGSFAWTLVANGSNTVELWVQPTFSNTGASCTMDINVDIYGSNVAVTK